jgi:PAS domain S-box-containing protein
VTLALERPAGESKAAGAPAAPSPTQTIAWRTLRSATLRFCIVVAIATLLSYLNVRNGLEQQSLASLERYAEQRQARESALFGLASANLAIAAAEYQKALAAIDVPTARERFAQMFEQRPDGTMRLTLDVFAKTSISGLIGRHTVIDDDLKRRLVAGVDMLARFGPAWGGSFTNLHLITPENAVLMYWPGQPWALNAADWEIFGKLALVSEAPDGVFVVAEQPAITNTKERWSGLYFDYAVNDWMASVTRPVVGPERHLVSIGHDIMLHELINRVLGSDLQGTYNVLFDEQGRLIAHPRYMDAIQTKNGALTVKDTGDPHLAEIYRLASTRPEGQTLVANPGSDEFLAVTRLGGPGWLLVTVLPRAIAASQAWSTARLILMVSGLALLIEILILYAALRREVTQPLRQLMDAATRIAAGRFGTRLDLQRPDEVGALASAFNTMAREIEARETTLSERSAHLAELNTQLAHELEERKRAESELARHRELNALLNGIDYGILFLDPDLRARIANRAYKELWGIPDSLIAQGVHVRELFDHNRDSGLYGVAPESWDAFISGRIAKVMRGDSPPSEMRLGNGRIVRYQCVALPDGGRMLTYLDVTDHKLALEALQAAEREQRRLLELAPFPLAVTRLSDGRVLYANARISAMGLGGTGAHAPSFYADPAERTRILALLERDGRVSDYEVEMLLPDGRRFWALINAALIDYGGEAALIAVFNSIEEIKERERQLIEAKRVAVAALRDLNAVLDTIDYGVLFLDSDLSVRLANRAYREVWDVPARFYSVQRTLREDMELSYRLGLYDLGEGDWKAYVEDRLAAIRAGTIPPTEMRFANGRVVQYQCIALPDGGRMLTYFDITELKRAEATLRRHLAAMETSRDGMAILGADGIYTYVNAAHARIYGFDDPAELVGSSWERLYGPQECERFANVAMPTLFRDGHWSGEAIGLKRDGTTFPQDVSLAALDGGGLICVVRDITERRQREEALQDAKRTAEEANRAKSAFLANMSHELRTPLNAIIGFTRIVLRRSGDVLPERQAANLEKILLSANHLLSLINDVLDLAKIESGRMDVKARSLALAPLVEACVKTIEPMVAGREVRLLTRIAPDLPLLISDEDKIRQILLNLLSNAAKFTERGSIVVSAVRRGARVEIAVADTGPGIPEEARELVFEAFRQADAGTTRQHGGTGLGLSISRHLAALIGGELSLESEVGRGSTFTLSLPVGGPLSLGAVPLRERVRTEEDAVS